MIINLKEIPDDVLIHSLSSPGNQSNTWNTSSSSLYLTHLLIVRI
jgi:hypothetical protein